MKERSIVARELRVLDVFSIGTLIALFGWFQVDIHRKMEAPAAGAAANENPDTAATNAAQ